MKTLTDEDLETIWNLLNDIIQDNNYYSYYNIDNNLSLIKDKIGKCKDWTLVFNK